MLTHLLLSGKFALAVLAERAHLILFCVEPAFLLPVKNIVGPKMHKNGFLPGSGQRKTGTDRATKSMLTLSVSSRQCQKSRAFVSIRARRLRTRL